MSLCVVDSASNDVCGSLEWAVPSCRCVKFIRYYRTKELAVDIKITLFMSEGRKVLLEDNEFGIMSTRTEAFVPPQEAEEMRYFLLRTG